MPRCASRCFAITAFVALLFRLETKVADVDFNCPWKFKQRLILVSTKGVDLIVFPELCITGYSCGDLFYQQTLLEQARRALVRLPRQKTKASSQAVIVGLPLLEQGKIFNCAACLVDGEILGIVPKINIPNSGEYYEKRWFASGNIVADRGHLMLDGDQVPFWYGPFVPPVQPGTLHDWDRDLRGPLVNAPAQFRSGCCRCVSDCEPLSQQ